MELFCDEALDTQLKTFLAELKETPKPSTLNSYNKTV
jgi:hypothetical protein